MSRATAIEIATLILALALFAMSQLVAPADEPRSVYEPMPFYDLGAK